VSFSAVFFGESRIILNESKEEKVFRAVPYFLEKSDYGILH